MSLFSSKTDVSKLLQKSSNIVNVFTKTVNDLKEVNEQIETAMEEKQEERKRLETDITTLDTLKSTHVKVISKITSIFE